MENLQQPAVTKEEEENSQPFLEEPVEADSVSTLCPHTSPANRIASSH